MFKEDEIKRLAESNRNLFLGLREIETTLQKQFFNLEPAIRALVLSALTAEPLLLVGEPGTAKSALIRAFCRTLGVHIPVPDQTPTEPYYFEYLLSPFTEPGELFGFYDIKDLMGSVSGEAAKAKSRSSSPESYGLKRIEIGKMQNAAVIYLDEVFNASSAVLNSLLAFMNERVFHDQGQVRPVKWMSLFGATNRLPETAELRATLDRFTLRCEVKQIEATPEMMRGLLDKGWELHAAIKASSNGKPLLSSQQISEKLPAFQEALWHLNISGDTNLAGPQWDGFYRRLACLTENARRAGLSEMSNRRLVKICYILLANRMYELYSQPTPPKDPAFVLGTADLRLIPQYFLDRPSEYQVQQLLSTCLEGPVRAR